MRLVWVGLAEACRTLTSAGFTFKTLALMPTSAPPGEAPPYVRRLPRRSRARARYPVLLESDGRGPARRAEAEGAYDCKVRLEADALRGAKTPKAVCRGTLRTSCRDLQGPPKAYKYGCGPRRFSVPTPRLSRWRILGKPATPRTPGRCCGGSRARAEVLTGGA